MAPFLPDPVWESALSFVPVKDIGALMATSKHFRNLVHPFTRTYHYWNSRAMEVICHA